MSTYGSNTCVWLLALGATAFAGSTCSSSSGGTSPRPVATAEAGADSSLPDASIPDVEVSDAGEAGAAPDAGAGVPVAGATVCVYQTPSIACATTDATGLFTLRGLLPMTNVPITVAKDGYRPALVPIQTASTNMDGTSRPIDLERVQWDPVQPDPMDWTRNAVVSFFAIALLPGYQLMFGGDPGASVALTPMAGDGPYYVRDDGTYVPDASTLVATAGIYANLPPGTYELTIRDTNHDCSPILTPFAPYGYPAGTLTVEFPALAGYITGPVGFFCTDKTALVDAGP